MMVRSWQVNGEPRRVEFEDGERLVDVLRERMDLAGAKEGCGEGECGACSVIVEGTLVLSCLLLAGSVTDGARILTVEGLAALPLGAGLQKAFIEKGAVQCGYCTPGMLLASYALLVQNASPRPEEVRSALAGNLCRCTGYEMIVEAVMSASGKAGGEGP